MEDVKKAFQDIAPKLKLRESPPMQNLKSVPNVKDYLIKNHFRFYVLAINAERIMFSEHQSEESKDYRQLLETMENRVGKIRQILLGRGEGGGGRGEGGKGGKGNSSFLFPKLCCACCFIS